MIETLTEGTTSLIQGPAEWEGVVMVERPDPTSPSPEMCRVMSARTIQLGGRRAIYCHLPLSMFQFNSDDGDVIFCEAEYRDGHLQIYGRARTNLKEWVLYSQTQKLIESVN